MGGRQAVRPRTLDPVSKVRILPAQPVFGKENWQKREYKNNFYAAPFVHERRPSFHWIASSLATMSSKRESSRVIMSGKLDNGITVYFRP